MYFFKPVFFLSLLCGIVMILSTFPTSNKIPNQSQNSRPLMRTDQDKTILFNQNEITELSQKLVHHQSSGIISQYFNIDDISKSFVLSIKSYPHKQHIFFPVSSILVVNQAQICIFDNFISQLHFLESSYFERRNNEQDFLFYPPFIIFTVDEPSYQFCQNLMNKVSSVEKGYHDLEQYKNYHRKHSAKSGGFISICVPPISLSSSSSSQKQPVSVLSVEYGDINYRKVVWLKPLLLSLALSSQLYEMVLLMDLDIILFKPFSWTDQYSNLLLHKNNNTNIGGGSHHQVSEHTLFQAACEIANDVTTVNTGYLVVFGDRAVEMVNNWTFIIRFPPPMDDQASFRQKISRKYPDLVTCFSQDYFKLSCHCDDTQNKGDVMTTSLLSCSASSIALHCTEVPNKTEALDQIGLWKPSLTSHRDCSYGVSERWWEKHPRQRLLHGHQVQVK